MKLGKRFLVGGFFLAAALLLIDAQVPRSAEAQQPQKKGKKAAAPSFKSDQQYLAAFRDAIATAAKSTVRVKCDGAETALGVVLTADGFILTKASDLKGKLTVKISTGEELDAKWIGHHNGHDLAVLKITAVNLTPIEFTDSKAAPVGNFVASVGTGTGPVATGVVSVAARNIAVKDGAELLAIKTADDPRGVKVTSVGTAGDVKGGKGGGFGKGFGKGGGKGDSLATGKVKADDFIVAVGTRAIKNSESLTKELQKYKLYDELTLRLIRGDEFIEQNIKLIPPPATPKGKGQVDQNTLGSELSKRITGFPVILQHDSVILPKDCGSALVDLDGHVIGINIARAGRVESHAVPSEVIRPLLPDLMSGKLPPPKR